MSQDDCLVAADGERVDFMFSQTLFAKTKLGIPPNIQRVGEVGGSQYFHLASSKQTWT